MNNLLSRYGPWALITGASSGIGEEFAKQLARHDFHLLLCARRKDCLDHLGSELSKQHCVEVKTVQADLSQAAQVNILKEASQGLDIGLMISNAGAEVHGPFLSQDPDRLAALTQLHVMTPVSLAHFLGNQMSTKGRGGVLFVSSITALGPIPYLAHYAATKAFLLHLGASLAHEWKKAKVDVTVLLPGITVTEMTKKAEQAGVDLSQAPFPKGEAFQVVERGLQALGNKPVVVPGLMNKCLFILFNRLLPRKLSIAILGKMMEKVLHLNV